jgi:urease accessory protein
MSAALHLTRLLQLASPALPVGSYSYSQGLETAIELAWVTDERTALAWIGDQLELNMGRCEAPVWMRLYQAWATRDLHGVDSWTDFFLATRDAAELRAETLQTGYSLARLLAALPRIDRAMADAVRPCSGTSLRQMRWSRICGCGPRIRRSPR